MPREGFNLKQCLIGFTYYAFEMIIVVLALVQFNTIDRPENVTLFVPYLLWMLALFVVVAVPMIFMRAEKVKLWLFVAVPILFVLAMFGWNFGLLTALIMIALPMWRLLIVINLPPEHTRLFSRFTVFLVTLISSFVLTHITDTQEMVTILPAIMWATFAILILGLFYFNYVTAVERTGQTLREWIKNQPLVVYGLLIAGIVVVGSLFLPVLRYILFNIIGPLLNVVATFLSQVMISILLPFFQFVFSVIEEEEAIPLEHEGDPEEFYDELHGAESIFSDTAQEIMGLVFQGILVIVVVFIVYYILKQFYFSPNNSKSKAEGESVKIDNRRVKPSTSWFRRPEWAKDEIRRQYQALLLHARKKEEEALKASHTAREWSLKYIEDENVDPEYRKIWDDINSMYEKRRYSEEALTKEEVAQFAREIKRAKKEIDQYYKQRKKEQKRKA